MQYLQFFILFVFCFCLKSNLAKDTITLAQPITDPEYIISKNNAFKLGFFSPVNTTNRYVGIWYHNIPVRTVVWVANREKPLADSFGTMMISENRNLVVLNGQKEIIWSSNVSNSSTNSNSAQLLDSGNLVLRNNYNGRTIWESFQYPSDSFLSRMELSSDASTGEKTLLKSWKSPSDPSIGSFSTGINSSSFPEVFIWNGSHPYWRSGPWNGQTYIGVQVKPRHTNTMNFVYTKEGNASITFINSNDSVLMYYFLNYNGNLMEMSWMEGMQEPEVTMTALQSDCDVYGKCGPFGSCNSRDSPICSCLKGFKPKVAKEWDAGNFTSGCVRRMALQCERNNSSSQENKHDWFLKLTTMKVPVSEVAIPGLVSEVDCEIQCLKNCYCAAYAFDFGIGCMLWKGSLIDIQKFSSLGADLYIRLAYSELEKKRNIKIVIAISVIIGSLIMAFCGCFTWMWMVKQKAAIWLLSMQWRGDFQRNLMCSALECCY